MAKRRLIGTDAGSQELERTIVRIMELMIEADFSDDWTITGVGIMVRRQTSTIPYADTIELMTRGFSREELADAGKNIQKGYEPMMQEQSHSSFGGRRTTRTTTSSDTTSDD